MSTDDTPTFDPSAPLDEKALRRPTWVEGVPVTLWDGQVWHLPRPTLAGFYPRRSKDGLVEAQVGYSFGPDYDYLLDEVLDATEVQEQVGALMAVAAHLLITNYDLPDEALPRLLYYAFDGQPRREDNRAMWEAIQAVAFGQAPKATPVGSA